MKNYLNKNLKHCCNVHCFVSLPKFQLTPCLVGYRPPIWFPLDLVLCKRCLFMGRNVKTETKGCSEEEQNGLGLVIKIFPSIHLSICIWGIVMMLKSISTIYRLFYDHFHIYKIKINHNAIQGYGMYFKFKMNILNSI